MIIDDDKEFLEEMSCVLISSGYKVAKVSDSTIAVKEAVKFAPETKDIPIVAITGIFTRQKHRFLMKTYNIKECLTKPTNPTDIIAIIEKMRTV